MHSRVIAIAENGQRQLTRLLLLPVPYLPPGARVTPPMSSEGHPHHHRGHRGGVNWDSELAGSFELLIQGGLEVRQLPATPPVPGVLHLLSPALALRVNFFFASGGGGFFSIKSLASVPHNRRLFHHLLHDLDPFSRIELAREGAARSGREMSRQKNKQTRFQFHRGATTSPPAPAID